MTNSCHFTASCLISNWQNDEEWTFGHILRFLLAPNSKLTIYPLYFTSWVGQNSPRYVFNSKLILRLTLKWGWTVALTVGYHACRFVLNDGPMSLRIKLLRCFYSCKSNRKQWKCYSFLDSLYSHDQAAAFNETNTKQQTTIATQPSIEQLKIQIFPSEVGRDQNRAKRVSILGFIIHQVVWHTIPNSSQSEQLAAWLTELTCCWAMLTTVSSSSWLLWWFAAAHLFWALIQKGPISYLLHR